MGVGAQKSKTPVILDSAALQDIKPQRVLGFQGFQGLQGLGLIVICVLRKCLGLEGCYGFGRGPILDLYGLDHKPKTYAL